MKNLMKLIIFIFITFIMFTISTEVIKASRDQLRLINTNELSKSIQSYYNINGEYPESGLGINVAEQLYNDELLTKSPRDPAYTSATVPLNYYYYKLTNTYNDIYEAIKDFDAKKYITQLKSKLFNYIGIDKENEKQRKQGIDSWGDSSNVSIITIIDQKNNDLLTQTMHKQYKKFDRNGIPVECVIAYKADNETNSYEISVFLESRFYKEKMKWDGGYDNYRYEIGNDLRLNTELTISDNGLKAISENVSIIK